MSIAIGESMFIGSSQSMCRICRHLEAVAAFPMGLAKNLVRSLFWCSVSLENHTRMYVNARLTLGGRQKLWWGLPISAPFRQENIVGRMGLFLGFELICGERAFISRGAIYVGSLSGLGRVDLPLVAVLVYVDGCIGCKEG
jgi:hypothetical protein